MVFVTSGPKDGYGFFGNTGHGGVIDLNLVFQGNVTGGNNTGALIGIAGSGTGVIDVSVKSRGNFIIGNNNVGGLIGFMGDGLVHTANPIMNSSSDFSVKAEQDNAGGLIGYVAFARMIDNSSASGSVEARGINAGGLIGHLNHGNISNSTATGSVSSQKYAGAFIGYVSHPKIFDAYNPPAVLIEDSFASGSVAPSGTFGRFFGGWDEGFKPTVVNSFYRNDEVDLTNFPDENWIYPGDDSEWEVESMPPPDEYNNNRIIFWVIAMFALAVLLIAIDVYFRRNNG